MLTRPADAREASGGHSKENPAVESQPSKPVWTWKQSYACSRMLRNYDASCAGSGRNGRVWKAGSVISPVMASVTLYTPDARCVSLLKLLLTNYCSYDAPIV
jgi:hypothetical protein